MYSRIVGCDVRVFGGTFLTAELAEFWVRSRGCPICDEELHAAASLTPMQHWLCPTCGHCWALLHGHLHSVDALTCQGCATHTKGECLSRFGARFPAFTGGGLPDEAT
jgi:hypothetical protein